MLRSQKSPSSQKRVQMVIAEGDRRTGVNLVDLAETPTALIPAVRGLRTQGEGLDLPVVRQIVRNAAEQDYSLVSIVLGIVDSYPFQMRTNGSASAAATIAQTRD